MENANFPQIFTNKKNIRNILNPDFLHSYSSLVYRDKQSLFVQLVVTSQVKKLTTATWRRKLPYYVKNTWVAIAVVVAVAVAVAMAASIPWLAQTDGGWVNIFLFYVDI